MERKVFIMALCICIGVATFMVPEAKARAPLDLSTPPATCSVGAGQGGIAVFPWIATERTILLQVRTTRTVFIYKECGLDRKPTVKIFGNTGLIVDVSYEGDRERDVDYGWRLGFYTNEPRLVGKVVTVTVTTQTGHTFTFMVKVTPKGLTPAQLEEWALLKRSVGHAKQDAEDAKTTARRAEETAEDAKKRKSANMSFGMEFFYTFIHQGADIRYAGDEDRFWPSGGIGLAYTWWFFTWSKGLHNLSLGVTTRLRWHRLVLTIDGAPQDDDVPGDQYEMLLNLSGRYKVGRWVSFDLYFGAGVGLFHHQDQISQQDPNGDVLGPEHNLSFIGVFNAGGGINLHLGQFLIGLNLMGALNPKGLLHPDFEGEPRYSTVLKPVKHLFFGLKVEYNF